jgi:excinuclease ABC subunit A
MPSKRTTQPDQPASTKRSSTRAIRLRGVRTNNLKAIDLDLPANQLIVVTGVSGSGKSSLAFDTLYAEGQRRYVETFSPYLRQFLERMEKPPADRIDGLSPAVAVSSRGARPSHRSTVGTLTEIHPLLGLLYTRVGVVVCRTCGAVVVPASPQSVAAEIDKLPDGTRYLIAFPLDLTPDSNWAELARMLIEDGLTRVRIAGQTLDLTSAPSPPADLREVDVIVDRMICGREAAGRRIDSIETAFQKGLGRCRILVDEETRTYLQGWRCGQCGTDHIEPQPNLFRYNSPLGACPACEGLGIVGIGVNEETTCPACQGARLRPEALAVRVAGANIAELSALPMREFRRFLTDLPPLRERAAIVRILHQIMGRLDAVEQIGIDYLTLDRRARSLSVGELDRVILTRTVGAGLVNTLYVLDEPTNGLHPHDVDRLIAILGRLRDQGNTVIVVEHDPAVIRAGDRVIDLGPGAGDIGGQVVFEGPYADLLTTSDSVTADYLSGRKTIPTSGSRRPHTRGVIQLRGATGHNLKGIDVDFPLGVFCVLTGLSGSGKSTLLEQTLASALRIKLGEAADTNPAPLPHTDLTVTGKLGKMVSVDSSPIGRSGRSNPVTYLDAFGEIRKTFAATHEAKTRNYKPSHFSFNVDGGRCNSCRGEGILTIDMQFLPDVVMRCPDCRGTRYRPEILEVPYRGRNIAEVLDMTARDAFVFFRHRPKVQMRLRPLLDIGLDYLRLGQPASTLSGGEAQRVKLASHLAQTRSDLMPGRSAESAPTLFLLNEPTSGLHPADIVKLLEVLNSLIDRGHSVIAIEHNPEVMARADWIIDMGPEAGDKGGRIVAQGTPEDVARTQTHTGAVLAGILNR